MIRSKKQTAVLIIALASVLFGGPFLFGQTSSRNEPGPAVDRLQEVVRARVGAG